MIFDIIRDYGTPQVIITGSPFHGVIVSYLEKLTAKIYDVFFQKSIWTAKGIKLKATEVIRLITRSLCSCTRLAKKYSYLRVMGA